jgi:hypothetical protein
MAKWQSLEEQPYAEYGIQICKKVEEIPSLIPVYAAFKHTHHLADPSDPASEVIEHIEKLGDSGLLGVLKIMIQHHIKNLGQSGRPDEEDIL